MNTKDEIKILKELKALTYNKENLLIERKLKELNKEIKGIIFEKYLAFLFEGNGFISTLTSISHDGGADIILSNKDNPNKVVWIVQAKNTKNPLGNNEIKKELTKFEMYVKKKYNCKYYMIISINGYRENIEVFNKTNMALENFQYIDQLISNYSRNNEKKILLPDLKPHNRYTYKEIKSILDEKNRVAVPNATGTGKSYIILQLLFDYMKKDCIILAPTNEILDKLKLLAPWSVNKCKMYTYSKLSSMYEKKVINNIKIDLIILDEMHRAGAKGWGKAVDYLLESNSKAKVVGLSATPIRFLDNNKDMIEELFKGSSTTPIGLTDAIVRKILPSPIYVSAIYNLDKEIEKRIKLIKSKNLLKEEADKYINELNTYKEVWENDMSIEKIINKHTSKYTNLKFIIFCENNKHLNEVKDKVIKWFENLNGEKSNVGKYIVTSKLKDSKNVLKDFEEDDFHKYKVKLLFSISKLNEGIHVKNISGIIMLRNTKSPIVYYQQLGRCLTADILNENPIVFDFVDNIENLELFNFRNNINESLKENNIYRESIGFKEEKIRFSLYEEHKDIILKLENIESRITYNWNNSFNSLVKFNELYGHLNVPNTEEYKRLYNWISLQRTLNKKGMIEEENKRKLNSINFIWDLSRSKWIENYYKYDNLIINSHDKKARYYKVISKRYYIPIYDEKTLLPMNKEIIKWMEKQFKLYEKNELEDYKKDYILRELREINQFDDNKWMNSLYKIIEFNKYIKDKFGINIDLYRISANKNNFINIIKSFYPNSSNIEATIEKNLPKEGKVFTYKYINDEMWYRGFVIHLLKESYRIYDILKFIDELNIIYYEDLIDMNYEFMKEWYKYNLVEINLDYNKSVLLEKLLLLVA